MEERCNNFLDCKDGSDEDSCETLIIDQISYRKRMPPISRSKKVHISVSITVKSFTNIDELAMAFKADLNIKLQWRDERIKFKNLAENGNFLSHDKQDEIWIPRVYFSNTEGNVPIANGDSMEVMVFRQGLPEKYDKSELNEGNTYNGAENNLVLTSMLEPKFKCLFELTNFPFDTQHCSIDIERFPEFRNYTVIIPKELTYQGDFNLIK